MTATTPIKGYREQTAEALNMVNENKVEEEHILRNLDALRGEDEIEQRWLAIARTHFEQAYMALNRAIMRPERIDLP